MALHASPCAPQICHWYWKLIGDEPDHVPGFAVRVLPTVVLPLIVGSDLFDGAEADRAVAPLTATNPASAATAKMRKYHFMGDLLTNALFVDVPCPRPVETAFYRPLTFAYASFTDGKPGVSSIR
jgi:hypothetical protein